MSVENAPPYCLHPGLLPLSARSLSPTVPHLFSWFTPGPHLGFECPAEKPWKVLEEGMLLSHGRPSGTPLRRSQVGRLERQPGGGEKVVGEQEDESGENRAVETGAGFRARLRRPGAHFHSCSPPHQAKAGSLEGPPGCRASKSCSVRSCGWQDRQTPRALGAAPDLTPLHKTFQSVRIAITPLGGNFPACRHQWDLMGIQTTAHELGLISPILQMRNQSFRVKRSDSWNRGLLMAPCPPPPAS